MSGTDTERLIRRARSFRAANVPAAFANAFTLAVSVAIGWLPLTVFAAFLTTCCLAMILVQTRVIRTLERTQELNPAASGERMTARERALRHVTGRPRRTMTPEDYRRLRELEEELGWELSELPASVTDPIRSELARVRAEAVRAADRADRSLAKADRALREAQAARQALRPSGTGSLTAKPLHPGGVWSTSGSGRCTCPPCQQSMREARGKSPETVAAEHFAGLARVGREHCLTYCPICQYRLSGPIPGAVIREIVTRHRSELEEER